LAARVNSCPDSNRHKKSFSAACEAVPFHRTDLTLARYREGSRIVYWVGFLTPTCFGHQVICTDVVKSRWRVGASTGISHVSYCRNGLISRCLPTHKSPETFQSHCVLPPGMKFWAIFALRTAN